MTIHALGTPWASPGERQFSLPTSLLLKLALGEAPEHVPSIRDVTRGALAAAQCIDGGPVDRIVVAFAGRFLAVRPFSAVAGRWLSGQAHHGYDAVEQATGMARTLLLRVPAGTPIGALCDSLAQLASVESVTPNYVAMVPMDAPGRLAPVPPAARFAQDARALVRMADAHAIERGDSSVTVGLIDSGIARQHPEFAHAFRAGADTVRLEPGDLSPGVQLLSGHGHRGDFPEDRFVGHGMGCAGIIAAEGVAMPRGLGGDCRILPMRALAAARLPGNAHAVGLGAIADLDRALKLAVDLGAKVINMSFGTDDATIAANRPKPHADTIAYAAARGCILVAASGNNGSVTRYWPAAYPQVIAVGAVGDDGRPTPFSTRGPHVALCAPGERVLTSAIEAYQLATGTSFAAPFVAGAAALLVAYAQRRAYPLDGATARDLLVATARPFAPGAADGCGAGILDAAAALQALSGRIDAYEAAGDDGCAGKEGSADDG
ncbi:peptidase S8 [Burkholderia sp. JP2-270]|uniref:S8 family peptidase n=1 Tax=Burkholderia sp. JP2-270 TaxID=2217913 RepID=UPI000DA326CC|nr:S8 family serine peptidase [Burkholderia sp. JP2-270]AWV04829.1 peptidase S8 [Burkholderia sp. JP2-270]